MKKKIVITTAATMMLGAISATCLANGADTVSSEAIHWGKAPIHVSAGDFQNGQAFCRKKYFGQKTCIPAINNTSDILTVITSAYGSDTAVTNSVATLMGKDKVDSVTFTVQDTAADGKVTTVYSGPANNREGVICNQDQTTKAITCDVWK